MGSCSDGCGGSEFCVAPSLGTCGEASIDPVGGGEEDDGKKLRGAASAKNDGEQWRWHHSSDV